MRKLFFIITALLLSPMVQALSTSLPLGEERIDPVFFPKLAISSDYSIGKQFHGFDDESFRYDMSNAWGGALSFEAGLFRYFNAGAMIAIRIPVEFKKHGEPFVTRFILFAKPFYPVTNSFAVFSRIGVGIMSTYGTEKSYLSSKSRVNLGGPYHSDAEFNSAFGATASASAGLEFFPMSRVGLAVEFGIRADFAWLLGEIKSRPYHPPVNPNGKTVMSYMTYDFPITVTLNMIP